MNARHPWNAEGSQGCHIAAIPIPRQYIFPVIGISLVVVLIIIFCCCAEFAEKLTVTGMLTTDKAIVNITAPIAGIIKASYQAPGARVHTGDKLFLIDSASFSLTNIEQRIATALHQRQTLLRQAITNKNQHQQHLARLLHKKYISVTEYNQNQAELLALRNSKALLDMEILKSKQARFKLITAPTSGIITNILSQSGQSIPASKILATLLPNNAMLTGQLYVPTHKIDFLHKTKQVLINYHAYPFQRFGYYSSNIEYISPTFLTDNQEDKPIKVEEPYYKVIVHLGSQYITANGKKTPLRAGMTFSATLIGTKRKLWRWLFEPIYSCYGRLFVTRG